MTDSNVINLLMEMKDNCLKGNIYDDPKRNDKAEALNNAIFAIKYLKQALWERDYLQGFVDGQRKIAKERKEYTDKRNFYCFEDLCDLDEMDICDVCRTQYEHGVNAGVAMSNGYALAYNAEQLRGFTKMIHCYFYEDNSTIAGEQLANYRCSACGKLVGTWKKGLSKDHMYRYCPWCGAKRMEADK